MGYIIFYLIFSIIVIQFALTGVLFHPQSRLRIAKCLLNPAEVLEEVVQKFSKELDIKWSIILFGIVILIFLIIGIVAPSSFLDEAMEEIPLFGILFSVAFHNESNLMENFQIADVGYMACVGSIILLISRLIVQYAFRKIKYMKPVILAVITVLVSMALGQCFQLIHLKEAFNYLLTCAYAGPRIIFTVFMGWVSFVFLIEYYTEFMTVGSLLMAYYDMMVNYGIMLNEKSPNPHLASHPIDPFNDVWLAISNSPGFVKILLCIALIAVGFICKEVIKRFFTWLTSKIGMFFLETNFGNSVRIILCVFCAFMLVSLVGSAIMFGGVSMILGYGDFNVLQKVNIGINLVVLCIFQYWLVRGYKSYNENSNAEQMRNE